MDKADAINIAQKFAGAVNANYNYIKISHKSR